MGKYNKALSNLGSSFAKGKLGEIQIPYWLGQTLVIARKR